MKPRSTPISQVILAVTDGGVEQAEQEYSLAGPVIQVGRGPGNDLIFTDPRVSSMHGRIVIDDRSVHYQDLGSTNGSALTRAGKKLPPAGPGGAGTPLVEGDLIKLGDADRPSSIRLVSTVSGPLSIGDATIVAQRALGEIGGLPSSEAFRRLLGLLADLRTEQDSFALTRKVLTYCVQVIGPASKATCFMRDTTGGTAPVLAVGPEGQTALGSPPSATLLERISQDRQALLLEDLQAVANASASMRTMPVRSLVLAPLVVDGQVVGALQVGAKEGGRLTAADLDLVTVLAQQLSAVLAGSQLIAKLRKAEDRLRGQCAYLKKRLGARPALDEMIGRSASMGKLREQISAVAPSRTTVLIQGDTGTGKELVARALHENSPRADGPFAVVNCTALAAGLLESELFGHVKGAFTGAHRDRKGLFEVADGGSLFLDEVGDMPPELQPKLLRVLEQGTFSPVGATQPRQVDVRVICATHRNLEAEVEAGRFRQDLLFRINVFNLQVPSLRNRPDDVLPLARHFLAAFQAEQGKPAADLSAETAAALQAHDWPGNVRELKNEMERAALLCPEGSPVDCTSLSERFGVTTGDGLGVDVEGSLKDILERLEAMVLKTALQRHKSNRTHCAKALGISRQALIAKIQRLRVEEDD